MKDEFKNIFAEIYKLQKDLSLKIEKEYKNAEVVFMHRQGQINPSTGKVTGVEAGNRVGKMWVIRKDNKNNDHYHNIHISQILSYKKHEN